MGPVQPISDEQLPALLAALAEAARAERRTAERFVPPRIGILEETAARRHQFVLGRRGVGKSTLLRKIESSGNDAERIVVFVDIETLRDRPYPDVLIELLIELLDGLRGRLTRDAWYRVDQGVARFRVHRRLASSRPPYGGCLRSLRWRSAQSASCSRALPAGPSEAASRSATGAKVSMQPRRRPADVRGRKAQRGASSGPRWTAC